MSIAPSTAKIGDTVKITWTITDPDLQKKFNTGKTFQIGICSNASYLPDCSEGSSQVTLKDVASSANSVTIDYVVGNKLSPPKTYSLGASVKAGSVVTGDGTTSFYGASQLITFTSQADDNTGKAQLKLNQTSQ